MMVVKSPCPPLKRKLPECVLAMVMDVHGRAPCGIPNDVYYSVGLNGVPIKALIDAIVVHMDSFQTYHYDYTTFVTSDVEFIMKRTATTMASLMHKRVHTYMEIGGVWYPRCFVEAISKKRTSIKISNTVWKGKWVRLDSLQAAHLAIRN